MPAVRQGLAPPDATRATRRVPEIIVSTGGQGDQATPPPVGCSRFTGQLLRTARSWTVHGWGDLQPELNRLSKQGRWEDMGRLIDDDILHTIAACGSPGEIAAHIRDRCARRLRPDLRSTSGPDRGGVTRGDR